MDGMGQNGYPLRPANLAVSSKSLAISKLKAPVAQWIEYCPPKAGVARSNRVRRANFISKNNHLGSSPEALRGLIQST